MLAPQFEHWIDGHEVPPTEGAYLESFSPSDGTLRATIARGTAADADLAARSSASAQRLWADRLPRDRGRVLSAVAAEIRSQATALINLEISETGKPWARAAAEVEGAASFFEFYGGVIRSLGGETIELGPDVHAFTRREPFGVVGIITPWNGPLNQAARAAAPALAAGNAVVVKPSEFTSTTTLGLARLAEQCGLPPGALNVVTGTGPEAGTAVVMHPAVGRVVFTGSVATGRVVAGMAAQRLIPATLELGGKSPFLVFADANLSDAAESLVHAFTDNSGQYCSAGTRLVVERSIHDELVERVVEKVKGLDPAVDLGPLITEGQFRKVNEYFDIARDEGATALVGGKAIRSSGSPAEGFYVPPTVYTDVDNDMRIASEEIFGPVLAVQSFDTEAEALAIANGTSYGLVAGVWTNDVKRAHRVANRLEAGQVYVNGWGAGVELPFGGYKESGYGREKGLEALHEYTRVKSVVVRLT